MAEQAQGSATEERAAAPEGGARVRPRLRDAWQAPTLILATALLAAGLLTARVSAPEADVDGVLREAEALIDEKRYEEALEVLNGPVLEALDSPEATSAQRRRLHLLRGDAIYSAEVDSPARVPGNYESVVREYAEAERFLAELDPTRQVALATSLLEIGREQEALERIRSLPEERGEAKRSLLMRIVEGRLGERPLDHEATLALLTELGDEPGLTASQRQWIVAREAELQLASGYVEEALTHLLRSIQRLGGVEGRTGAELLLLLARGYYELGRFEDALRQTERALALVDEASALAGEATLLAGRIRQMQGDLEASRDLFTLVVSDFPGSEASLSGLLGLAEVNASMSNSDASLEAYEGLVERLGGGEKTREVTTEIVTESLIRQQRERFIREDFDTALAYARLARRLNAEQTPAEVYEGMAQAHRRLAERLLGGESGAPGDEAPRDVDPVARAEARAHYAAAGERFLDHARAILLSDDEAFADSLWMAADSFDLASEPDRAIAAFSEFTEGRPEDPRQPAALLRLGQAHLALGDETAARTFFQQLIDQHPSSNEAVRAYVPLAQSHLLEAPEDASRRREARRLLEAVVSGRLLSPEAPEYRDALIELGRLHLDEGELGQAIRRLTEAIERYADETPMTGVKYSLADAHRRRAAEIAKTLTEAMPESERQERERRRRERLERARALYDDVRRELERIDERRLTALQRTRLRNALFYRADAAFDLRDYETAIRHYDAAAQRYADDPASLVAMIQIVNAYVAMEAWREAQTANERARQRLEQLPDSAFDQPALPLEPRHWERWFESTATLTARADEEGSG